MNVELRPGFSEVGPNYCIDTYGNRTALDFCLRDAHVHMVTDTQTTKKITVGKLTQ